jgi:tetratricopeptide (TPR) repeat protein
MFMRIRFCKSMNQADPRAGRRKRGDAAELTIRVLVSFLVACVCAITASSQTSDDLALGLTEFSKGNFSSAAALFARAEEAAPGTTDALLYESKAYIHLEQFTAAEGALRRYLLVHAASGDALYLLGYVLHREGKATESLETYTKAAQHRIPAGDDLKIVGLNYVLLNDYPDAIKWLEKAVEAEPKNKEAWYFLGRAYYTKSRVPEARKAFLTVLELDPRDAKAENNLGLILESEAQPDAAMDAYRRAIQWQEQSVRPSEQPFLNLGSLLMEQSRVGEAIPLLQKAVALAPRDAICRLRLGTAYLRLGRLTDAERDLEKAVQLAPDDPAAHYQLGKLYKEMKALDRAKAEFDRTAELQSRAASSKPQ